MIRQLKAYAIAYLLISLLVLSYGPRASAIDRTIRFDHLTTEDGLSQGNPNAIIQDAQGFMWFGTQDGLNRFDGYQIRVYGNDPNNRHAISNDFVNALTLNSKSQLWIGTRGGLHVFDPASERFTNYVLEDPADPDLRDSTVISLVASPDGAIWIGTERGRIARFFPDRDRIDWFDLPGNESEITVLHLDHDRTIWIGTDDGLFQLRRDEQPVRFNDPAIANRSINAIYNDNRDRLWIGMDDHAGWFDSSRTLFTDLATRINSQVTTIWQDQEGNIWIGTLNDGLYRFDQELQPQGHYRQDPNDSNSLLSNEILSLFQDETGVIWIGTRIGGVAKFDPRTEQFGHIYGTDSQGGVYAVLEDVDGDLLFGTRRGLVVFDRQTGDTITYRHDETDSSLSDDWVSAIYQDSQGRLWVGTFGGGLNLFDKASGLFRSYLPDPDDPMAVGNVLVARIMENSDGMLWLATDSGLELFDPERGVIARYRNNPNDSESMSTNQVRSLYLDPAGRVWAGTRGGGLNILNPDTGKITRVLSDPDNPESLGSNSIYVIMEDSDGRVWLGTAAGLSLFDRDSAEPIRRYDQSDGLPNEVIYGVVEDPNRLLWISTNQGLSRFDTGLRSFHNFDSNDGLQGNEFNMGAYTSTAAGEMMFGGVNGVNLFYPPQIVSDATPARPVITDILLFNESISHRGQDPDSILAAHPSLVKEIELSYTDSVLTFEFSALHFANPANNTFAYRLEGLDDRWIMTDPSKRFATFTSLNPGRYTFQLKATNKDGVWNEDPVAIQVRVLPPPWSSWWAFSAYALLLALLSWALWRTRERRMAERVKAQRLIFESEERLRLALWGSGDELWDWNLKDGILRRHNLIDETSETQEELAPDIDVFRKRVHPMDFKRFKQAMESHLNGDAPHFEFSHRRRLGDGWIWVIVRGQVVVRDSQGKAERMSGTIKDITTLKDTEAALRELNDQLENRVSDRTQALRESNSELREALDALRQTQSQLVESEKMASLGNLVAGVAHEINTPLGISVTAASHLNDITRRFIEATENGTLKENQLSAYQTAAKQGSALILDNL